MASWRHKIVDLLGNFGRQCLRLRMTKEVSGYSWSIARLAFVNFLQQRPKCGRVITCLSHQTYSHQPGFEFLIPAVAKKWSIHAERDAEFRDLISPNLRGGYAGSNGRR